jgi:hypothetical protein
MMGIDWDAIAAAGGIPKGPPRAVLKAKKVKAREDADEKESAKVHDRSGRRCEVVWFGKKARIVTKCDRPSMPGVHHMLGGSGVRARGESLKAERKQDVCRECHDLITGKVLRRIGGEMPHYTDEYERVDR